MSNQVSRSTPKPTTIITIINCRVENVLEPRPPRKRRDRKCPRYPRCLLLGIMAGEVLQNQRRRRDGFILGVAGESARSKGTLPSKRARVKMAHVIRLSPDAKLGISWQNTLDHSLFPPRPLLPPSRSRRCRWDRPPLTRPRQRQRHRQHHRRPRAAAASATSG